MVLIVLVVVSAVALTGVFVLDGQSNRVRSQPPPAAFETEFGLSTLRLSHAGGEPFDLSDLVLELRDGGTQRRYDLGDPADRLDTSLDADGSFESGESVTVSHSATGVVRIVLVDTSPGGYVLYDEEK